MTELCDKLSSLNVSDVVEPAQPELSESNLQKYENLDANIKSKLLLQPPSGLDFIETSLQTSCYITAAHRKYIRLLLTHLENGKLNSAVAMLLKSTSSLNHVVPDATREQILPLFQKWKPILHKEGLKRKNKYFLHNGSLTPAFRQQLSHLDIHTSSQRWNNCFHVSRLKSREDFAEKM
jgi:hypothetical protein